MPEIVVSNTSPIFYLHRLRRLDLLQKLYQKVIVPEAVIAELEAGRRQGEDVPNIDNYEWIETRAIQSPQIMGLSTDFGPGETEVLALALEESESLVIIDEKLARKIARLRELRVTGTAGVLLRAKKEGHILAVKPFLDRLQEVECLTSGTDEAEALKEARDALEEAIAGRIDDGEPIPVPSRRRAGEQLIAVSL